MDDLDKRKQPGWKAMTFFLAAHLLGGFIYILVVKPGNMNDTAYWVYRIGALADEIRIQGVWKALPPRILSVSFNDYGYGAPLFYCDVFLWIPVILVLFGVSEFGGHTVLCAMIWGMRVIAAFGSASLVLKCFPEVKNRIRLAVLFAFSYSFFPYMLDVLLMRGAIGESLAGIFLPVIAAALYRIIHEKNRDPNNVLLLALGLFEVVCSHMVSIVITACFMAGYLLGHLRLLWNDKWKLTELLKACVLAVGMSAFWLFPFMEQYFAGIIRDMGGWWWNCVLSLSDWFISYYYTKDTEMWFPSTFGILLVSWTFLYLIHNKACRNKYISILLGISWLLCIAMTSRTVLKVLEGLFGFMQFAWRFLSVVALLLSIVIVYIFYASPKKKVMFAVIYMLYVACFLLGDIDGYHTTWISYTGVPYGRNNADDLYLPQGGFLGLQDVRGDLVDTNLSELHLRWRRLPKAQFWLKYSNNTGDAVVQLPLYYYKGYEAYDVVNQSRLQIEKGDVGLIWIYLDPYESGEIVVSYEGTTVQRISDAISLLTWIGLAVYGSVRWYHHRKKLRKDKIL